MRVVLLGIFLFSFMGAKVHADEYNYKQKRFKLAYNLSDSSHQILKIKGSLIISKGESPEKLLEYISSKLRPRVNTHLILDMFGGDIALVNKVYSIIKNKCRSKRYSSCEITTEVEMFRHCASACIPLFMVGDKRFAAERTNWGFHQAALIEGFIKIPFMSEYVLRSKGVDRNWLKQNKKLFKSLKISWLRPSELKGSNILTNIVPHPN